MRAACPQVECSMAFPDVLLMTRVHAAQGRLHMHAGAQWRSARWQDAMREHSLAELGAAWVQLVATYGQVRPDLAGAVLGAVQRYVPWIDISLVANDKCALRSRHVKHSLLLFVGPSVSA